MSDYFKRVAEQTCTRFWINNVTEREADLALEAGAVGCTQNPSYPWKMITSKDDEMRANVEAKLRKIIAENKTATSEEIETIFQRELVGTIAKHFLPLYEKSHGKYGYVSIQGDPNHETAEEIIRYARFNREAGPNIMCKVPVTEEGLKAIRVLVAEGAPINATECMAIRQVLDVCEVYQEVAGKMEKPAPLAFSLITGIFDEYLGKYVEKNNVDVNGDYLRQAGISVAKKVHEIVRQKGYSVTFIGGGARKLDHFTEMVGAEASITINWVGTAKDLIDMDLPVVSRFLQPTPHIVIDELIEKLPDYRKAYFINEIEPCEYEDYGPVVLFRSSFVTAWNHAIDAINSMR